ncbi:spermidine/putrescine transport system ATP-binding protein [Hydrogenispora ethanolica]|uniref:ABC-type quaternary amine transporter n=1 Tax=Hydrogenispora ethanolica TaxID=1082276 RepID=A0A4R1R7Z4_HYDET|nr:ABC transporter ATP-binding protein [Hydrogenispora ethanolica]TCL61771.1 spermidine/putrescine transport system ATP-binding protein [Hydrogenispora ethanolica]
MNEILLQMAVQKKYPEFRLQAELGVAQDEFFALVGPSGCGKTTLLRLISGLERPDSGRIILGGEDITKLPPSRRRIGMVFQDYALFPHLSVYQNIEYGLKVQRLPGKERRKRVSELLALFHLEELASRKIDRLSGGERQRVALARSLAPRPFLLLLDEPFSSLDFLLRQQLAGELKQWQKELGATFIFVSHQQEEALALSDRLAVMKNGRVVQIADPRTIYEEPVDSFVASFFGEANLLPVRVTMDPGAKLAIAFEDTRLAHFEYTPEPPGQKCTPGDYWLVVRPEEIVLETESRSGISAEVLNLDYLGYLVRLDLLIGATRMRALVGKEHAFLRPEERVSCRFRLNKPRFIPRNGYTG